jgi:hypoxanthine phosphoribosyltransferase
MNINTIGRVFEIFEKKNWELDEEMETSKFNLFCNMLLRLENEDEVDLMIELLEDFLHIDGDKYDNEITKILNSFLSHYPKLQTLFVLPLISEKDKDKNKSAHFVLYKFKGTKIKYKVPALNSIGLSVLDKPETLPFLLKDNQMVILVDDFIGTGDTSIEAIDYLLKLHPELEKNKIAIFSIVIQQHGLEYLIKEGFNVFYSIVIRKGISDKYLNEEKDNKLSIMKNVEDKLKKLKPEYRFGYKQSEGLVCMERTPNNTFPIFWYDLKSKYKPPFPR